MLYNENLNSVIDERFLYESYFFYEPKILHNFFRTLYNFHRNKYNKNAEMTLGAT